MPAQALRRRPRLPGRKIGNPRPAPEEKEGPPFLPSTAAGNAFFVLMPLCVRYRQRRPCAAATGNIFSGRKIGNPRPAQEEKELPPFLPSTAAGHLLSFLKKPDARYSQRRLLRRRGLLAIHFPKTVCVKMPAQAPAPRNCQRWLHRPRLPGRKIGSPRLTQEEKELPPFLPSTAAGHLLSFLKKP